MKKIVIAGMLASVVAGSGIIALFHSQEATAAPGPRKPPADAQHRPPEPPKPPRQDGESRPPAGEPRADRPADGANGPGGSGSAGNTSTTVQGDYTIVISGGFDTNPVDHGRPVVLIAAALGVPTEVFREAFSGVTPAGLDRGPTSEEAQSNKAALMKVLAPYGITNDRLDEVSNYYRYNGKTEGVWKRTLATATPILENGALVGVQIANAGSGYSSAPTVIITGPDGTVTATATVAYTQNFASNGSISTVSLNP
jgi:hypothetical protein